MGSFGEDQHSLVDNVACPVDSAYSTGSSIALLARNDGSFPGLTSPS